MSSLPARMGMIKSKMKELECSQDFSHYKSMGIFPDAQGPNFELVQDGMDVLITCKYEEDPIKNRGTRVFTTLYLNFLDAQGQITPESVVVSLIQAFMHVLTNYKNEDDRIKNEGARVFTRLLQL